MLFKLKHIRPKGIIGLNDYWIDDEFSVRYWDTKEEAEKFAKQQQSNGFTLEVEEYNE